MKHKLFRQRAAVIAAVVALAISFAVPVSASVLSSEDEQRVVTTFSKNGTVSEVIQFSAEDFQVVNRDTQYLESVILNALPEAESGVLTIGDRSLYSGDTIALSALDGLRFIPSPASADTMASFTFTPVFSNGEAGLDVKVNLYLLSGENTAPVAENMEFSTYKNVVYSGRISAVDPDGDMMSFQLVDKPARGSVTFAEDGSYEFTYTPYENKTGKDSFTFVAVDSVGNMSDEATVKIRIEKPSTKIRYADMEGHPAYNAAICLAEQDIFVGARMDGLYYFQPDLPVSRSEFLALAMTLTDLEELDGVTTTGFFDDEMISVWARPYVSSALKSGAVLGTYSENGQIVFEGSRTITEAEATVILNRLLSVTDISSEATAGMFDSVPNWASQAAANLQSVGVLQVGTDGSVILKNELTRADAASMLASALEVINTRADTKGFFA